MFDKSTFTYGYEMEVSDVPKSIVLPEHLGKWEYSECDIVNTKPPYRGICADPAGINPPVGGEINTVPTRGWQAQVDKIREIVDLFTEQGYPPVAGFTAHNHMHIHVPGLMESPEGLRKLMLYIKDNQRDFIEAAYNYYETSEMRAIPEAKNYLKLDGGRLMPDWRCQKIADRTTDFDSFILHHYTAQHHDGTGRPIRTGINTYCMKHTRTIEFRCFRASFEVKHLEDSFRFIELFIDAALSDGPSVRDILFENKFEFPPMTFDAELARGWLATKHKTGDTSGKNREFINV